MGLEINFITLGILDSMQAKQKMKETQKR